MEQSVLAERKDGFEQISHNRLRLSPAINGSADKASAYFGIFISKHVICFGRSPIFPTVKAAMVKAQTFRSSSHSFTQASEGIRQSPRGERVTLPTFGPSGRHERLNCCEKKRFRKTVSHFFTVSRSNRPAKDCSAIRSIFCGGKPHRTI